MAWRWWESWEGNDWGHHHDPWWESNDWGHCSTWDDANEKPQPDRFKHVSTLGCFGKHPMPLEDRKDLFLEVVNKLVPNHNLSQMSVACWTADTTMAAFTLLTNCGPTTPMRWLKDSSEKYRLPYAAEILAKAAKSVFAAEPGKLQEMVDFIVASSWIDHDGIVAKAIEVRKYDPNEAVEPDPWLQLIKSRMDSRPGAPAMLAARANPFTALKRQEAGIVTSEKTIT